MKNRLYFKAVSATVSAAILAASLQFANPVNAYAGEEISQIDTNSDSYEIEPQSDEPASDEPETQADEPASDEPETTEDSYEGQVTDSVDSSENQVPETNESNTKAPETNESNTENGLKEGETSNDTLGEKMVLQQVDDEALTDPLAGATGDTYENNDSAVEGYGIEERSDPYTLSILPGDGKQFILTGVDNGIYNSNEEITKIANAVNKVLSGDSTIEYLYNKVFVDAEKYSVGCEGYDSNYCWGATAANMLWLSGWAKELGYTNEDQIMTDLHDKFYDRAEEPRDAITWLFDNYITHVEVETKEESTKGGKKSDICISEAFETYENVAGELKNLLSLANVVSQATAIQCRWMNENGEIKEGSHWLTAVGVAINESALGIADYFKAIILADSDDNPSFSTSAPADETQSYNQRKDTCNVYKICSLETKNVNGVDYWYIPGYTDIDGQGALITGIEALMNYTSSLKDTITEQYGTKNVSNTLELIYSGVMYTYGENVGEPQYTFDKESKNVRIGYTNTSKISKQNVEVPVRVTICDNNNRELDSALYYISVDEIAANSDGYFDVNFDNLTTNLSEGDYKVKVMFNPSDAENKLSEAYYLNNDLVSTRIKLEVKSNESEASRSEQEDDDTSLNTMPSEDDEIILNRGNDMTKEQMMVIEKELEKEGISKDTIKAIEQIFDQGQTTYFAPDTKIDTATDNDYKVFMAGVPGEFISAKIDGVKLDLSELKIMPNSTNSYRIIFDGKKFKDLKKGKHRLVIYSVRGALPIVIEITVI